MKTHVWVISILILIYACTVSGCSISSPKVSSDLQRSFEELISIENLNKSLQVSVEKSNEDVIYFGANIHVTIENESSDQILIRAPEAIKLYVVDNGNWLEVNNNNEYYGNDEGEILNPPGPYEYGDLISTWIRPVLKPDTVISSPDTTIILRILVIGEQISDDKKTGFPVGAYTDVYLTP